MTAAGKLAHIERQRSVRLAEIEADLDNLPTVTVEIVTCARARFIRRTLGFKSALGYCRKRVPLEVCLYWLLGRGLS